MVYYILESLDFLSCRVVSPELYHNSYSHFLQPDITIPNDYCGTPGVNTPLAGTLPLYADPVFVSPTSRLSAVVATTALGKYTVAFAATSQGHVKKVSMCSMVAELVYIEIHHMDVLHFVIEKCRHLANGCTAKCDFIGLMLFRSLSYIICLVAMRYKYYGICFGCL